MRILVAEDEPASALLVEKSLEDLGHEPTCVSDGAVAWGMHQVEPFPVIITDWRMPEMDGLELCRRVRADPRPRYTYLVILTSVGSPEGFREGMRAGADDFMVKHLDPEQLEARLVVAERVLRLQSDLRTLQGLLPICSYCKRVREGQDYWQQVEAFVQAKTDARFSHSICPDCYQRHVVPELEALRKAHGTPPAA